MIKMEYIGYTCPVCGNANYMVHMHGDNIDDLDIKCLNCNSYFSSKTFPYSERSNKSTCSICESLEDGDTLYSMSDWDGGIGFDYIRDIHFCPKCGRDLRSANNA